MSLLAGPPWEQIKEQEQEQELGISHLRQLPKDEVHSHLLEIGIKVAAVLETEI